MPQTLYGNQVGSETLRAGKAVTMTIVAGSGATVERIRNGSAVAADAISATTVFGPFTEDMVLRVSVNSGATLTIGDEADQIVQRPTDAKATAIDSLVSEAENLLALATAYDIQPATWYNGSINSVATSHIVADGDLSTATDQVPKWWLIVLNAASDVEAAQRLLGGGPNVLTVLPGQTIQPPVQDYLGASAVLTTAHVVCISTATAVPADYTGGAYILSDAAAETLANALTNLAKFEWSSGLGCTSFRATASAVYSTNYSALMVAAGV